MHLGDSLHPLWWAMWLAPVPLLVASFSLRGRWLWLTVAATALLGVAGAASDLLAVGLAPAIIMTVGTLATWLGLVASARTTVLGSRHWLTPFAFPLLWAGIDTAVTTLSLDGAAGSAAFTQMDLVPLIQIAAITGQAGIVFLVGLFASTVAVAIHRGRRIERPVLAYGLPLVILAGALGWGALRPTAADGGAMVPVGLAAIDRPIAEYLKGGTPDAPIWARYETRIGELAGRGAKLVVLPEKIARVEAGATAPLQARLGAIAAAYRIQLVAGVAIDVPDHLENRSWLFGPDGTLAGDYSKQHMVPHLEDAYRPGHEAMLRMIEGARFGLAICKDMDFPPLGRSYSRLGATALLVPAWDFDVDGWYHDRMSVLLGVESGMTIIRSAMQGLMTVSDRYGRVLAEAPSEPGAGGSLFLAAVPLGDGQPTLYARFGDWFGWSCLALWAAGVLAYRWRRRGRTVPGDAVEATP
jgi:apolipoprotein N-acyltransferase